MGSHMAGNSLGTVGSHSPCNTAHVLVSRAGMLVATPASSLNGFIKGIG